MNKKTVFCITFFILSMVVLLMYYHASPTPSLDRFHLDDPRDININGIDFPISWGFLEDENSSDLRYDAEILNHKAIKEQRTFHQNDILLLNITVYDLGENVDINLLNDGSYHEKTINGVQGIFKNESATESSGLVKNTHPRYYFDYVVDGKIVMIQCDKLDIINEIV